MDELKLTSHHIPSSADHPPEGQKRFKLVIEYDGTAYSGWQRQINGPSVQQTLEEALARLTGEKIGVVGSSRTDAGVHAKVYVANFRTDARIPVDRIPYAFNTHLPGDIVVTGAMELHDGFNAIAVEDFFIVFVNQWEDHRIKPGTCIQRRADFACAKFEEFQQPVVIRERRWVTRVAENKRQDIVVLRLQGIERLCRQVAVEHAGIHRLITVERFNAVLKLFNFGAVDELGVVVHVVVSE